MAQKIGIDTVVFIYLLENTNKLSRGAQRILEAVEAGKAEAVLSIIGMIEILTGPKKFGRDDLALQYKELIANFLHLVIVGINENIVDIASDLRAQYSITTPDAIHLATAIDFGASKFFTNDKTLKKVKEIPVELI